MTEYPKKKKVLILGPGMEIGGVEKSLIGLLNAIDYSYYDVDLFLLVHSGELFAEINKNVRVLPENRMYALASLPIRKLFSQRHFVIGSIRLFCKLYSDMRSKIFHTATLNTTLCNKFVTALQTALPGHYDYALGFFAPHYFLNRKVSADIKIGWVHTDYSNVTEKPDVRFLTPMWSELDHIACVSDSVKQSFQIVYPALRAKTLTIENILSPELIRKQAEEFDVFEEMPEDEFIKILSVGRFTNAKNFDTIPEICRILIDEGYPIKWYLIGYGPDESLIREKIREYSVEDIVIMLGKKTNPYPYMKACDLYAQPSRYEGKAVTVREAQILHKPVMITRFETSASQVEEGVDGYICEMGIQGIVNGVETLIDHPKIRKRLTEATMYCDYGNSSELEKVWSLKRG